MDIPKSPLGDTNAKAPTADPGSLESLGSHTLPVLPAEEGLVEHLGAFTPPELAAVTAGVTATMEGANQGELFPGELSKLEHLASLHTSLELEQQQPHGGRGMPASRVFTPDEVEDADFRAVANVVNTILLPDVAGRGDVISHLSRVIPSNEFGLPVYYVRSDLLDLPTLLHRGATTQDEVDSASEVISYQDGYPTLNSGSPFWTRLPHEPQPCYILFQRFLELNELEGIRLIDTLASREALEVSSLRQMSLEYYWSARARAYDLFIVAADAKKREALTRKAENAHFTAAGDLLDKVLAKLNDDPELLDKMDAGELLDAFEQMVKIQRLSLGLTGQNASTTNKELAAPGASVEVTLRQLTKNVGPQGSDQDAFKQRLAALMGDEATALAAQDLVIRVNTGNSSNADSV